MFKLIVNFKKLSVTIQFSLIGTNQFVNICYKYMQMAYPPYLARTFELKSFLKIYTIFSKFLYNKG